MEYNSSRALLAVLVVGFIVFEGGVAGRSECEIEVRLGRGGRSCLKSKIVPLMILRGKVPQTRKERKVVLDSKERYRVSSQWELSDHERKVRLARAVRSRKAKATSTRNSRQLTQTRIMYIVPCDMGQNNYSLLD
ncbi:hypothetical protein H6P81_017439 [Aristolochia fimbriata]|uniref:Uncharacterized protein n=1 Tax=Aristolochia fimbriata TaxID=158543 RepID=A0AAV7DY80_ARIFI|nr:hypothetical protein H6P81_017439 [Aristolochia fimbriata]